MKSEEEQLRELDRVSEIAKECDTIEEFNRRSKTSFLSSLADYVYFYGGTFFWSVPRKRWYE